MNGSVKSIEKIVEDLNNAKLNENVGMSSFFSLTSMRFSTVEKLFSEYPPLAPKRKKQQKGAFHS